VEPRERADRKRQCREQRRVLVGEGEAAQSRTGERGARERAPRPGAMNGASCEHAERDDAVVEREDLAE
jgi:hypothetical protein